MLTWSGRWAASLDNEEFTQLKARNKKDALILYNKNPKKKVIVKRAPGDADDLEKALAIAVLKWFGFSFGKLNRLKKKVIVQKGE